jgi:hypothetical protein
MPTSNLPVGSGEFDVDALFTALDGRRRAEGLSWTGVADAIWQLSAELNDKRHDHPIAPTTLSGMAKRGNTSCQHALFILRWLGTAPEDFIAEPYPATVGVPLPGTDSAHRLRWSLTALHAALDKSRAERAETWQQAARRLSCTPSQLTGLRTAKFATGMRLAMRISQSLGRPAADFVYISTW